MLAYASTHILSFIVANLFIYSAFYLSMKLLHDEFPTKWVQKRFWALEILKC